MTHENSIRLATPNLKLLRTGSMLRDLLFSRWIAACSLVLVLIGPSLPICQAQSPPNFLVILADDLGFSDLGCYGSDIDTSNLDLLASRGIRFTQFYNTGRCWPTRAALLTGYYPHQIGFDVVPGEPRLKRHNRPNWAPVLPVRLAAANYRSYHSGKWHLDSQPVAAGFDRSYRMADHGRFFSPKRHRLDDQALQPVERGTDFYTTTEIANRAIEFLREHEEKHKDQPFFEFVAFTAPHFPLHALPEDIEKYRKKYVAGWTELRKQRWTKIQEMGLVQGKLSSVEPEVGPPYHFADHLKRLGPHEVNRPLAWDRLTAEQQEFQATKMAIHAAMIDRMDIEIGRILDQLREMNAFENTVIFFMSDNGASAEIMVRDDGHDPDAPAGSADSHLCLGPGFSNAANTPFRRHKTWVHEGGVRTPLIVHWPAGLGTTPQLNKTPGHVVDLAPTILELAGIEKPEQPDHAPRFPGISLSETMRTGESTDRPWIWWFHEDNQAIRVGDWKLVKAKHEPWQLFDLSADPTETLDLADQHPQQFQTLQRKWESIRDQFRIDNQNIQQQR